MNRRHWIQSVTAAAAIAPAAGRVTPRPLQAPPSDLEARLRAALAKHKVAGASMALFQDGKLEVAAGGVVNTATNVPLVPDTVMHIGSITKILNTTLVMQLVDDGLLELDQPVRRYWPEFTVGDPRAAEAITVKMLVNHTSGIDGEILPDGGHDRERIVDAIPRIAVLGQVHAPGQDLSYCNSAVVLAGHLVERLTKTSWYDLVKDRIFKRIGLEHAVVLPEDALLYRASVGHFLDPRTGVNQRTPFAFLPLSFAPAGATAMLSAADLVTFARAHLADGQAPNGNRLLSAASARAMRVKTGSYQGPGLKDFGLGWMLLDNGVVHHSGGGPGILSVLYAHPASGMAVAVLTNGAHGAVLANELVAPILARAAGIKPLGADATARAVQAKEGPVDPTPYVGQYENVVTVVRVVPHGNGIAATMRIKLKIYESTSLEETPPTPLRPAGNDQFAYGPTTLIGFVNRGSDGRMGHFAMGGRLYRRV